MSRYVDPETRAMREDTREAADILIALLATLLLALVIWFSGVLR